jgi:hypothetical protein
VLLVEITFVQDFLGILATFILYSPVWFCSEPTVWWYYLGLYANANLRSTRWVEHVFLRAERGLFLALWLLQYAVQ